MESHPLVIAGSGRSGTYLLLAIYCHEEHGERVSIKMVRELRNKILNETRESENEMFNSEYQSQSQKQNLYASP
jgi:hypothetical protein